MDLICDERPSDSPFIERVWYSRSDYVGAFTSIADTHCELVITRHQGRTTLTIRGPETMPSHAYVPADAEFIGIQFKAGVYMQNFPAKTIMDRNDVTLHESRSDSFYLNGTSWQFFNFDNADTFVNRLVRDEQLVVDPIVQAVLQGASVDLSLRTIQRRFLQATGLTYGAMYQIKRARFATTLLRQGLPILDTIERAGYFDQPHLTRALKQYIGQTPAQLLSPVRHNPLSFLYKTDSPDLSYDAFIQQTREVA